MQHDFLSVPAAARGRRCLAGAMALARAQACVRRGDRRRRRPRAGDGVLSGAEHGIRNVAVLDKGWLGGGNTGRNTTIIRSNYLWDESAALYEHALKLWEGLAQELNYNVMYSPRGVMMLAHNHHDVQVFRRHVHANRLQGIDNEWLTPEQAKAFCPPLDIGSSGALSGAWARRCSGAAVWRGTTRWPGVMRGRPARWAWISSRIAR